MPHPLLFHTMILLELYSLFLFSPISYRFQFWSVLTISDILSLRLFISIHRHNRHTFVAKILFPESFVLGSPFDFTKQVFNSIQLYEREIQLKIAIVNYWTLLHIKKWSSPLFSDEMAKKESDDYDLLLISSCSIILKSWG